MRMAFLTLNLWWKAPGFSWDSKRNVNIRQIILSAQKFLKKIIIWSYFNPNSSPIEATFCFNDA